MARMKMSVNILLRDKYKRKEEKEIKSSDLVNKSRLSYKILPSAQSHPEWKEIKQIQN